VVNSCVLIVTVSDLRLQAHLRQHAQTGFHLWRPTPSWSRSTHPDRFSCRCNWQVPSKKPSNEESWPTKTIARAFRCHKIHSMGRFRWALPLHTGMNKCLENILLAWCSLA